MQRFILLSMLCLWTVTASCGGQSLAAAQEKPMADILITQADRGQERQALPGQRVLIQLPENPTTGYQWQIEAFDPGVLSASGSDFAAASGGRLGGGGLRTFVFTALAPGGTPVRLVYRRPWEPKAQAGEAFEVRIHVRMKAQP
jgi:inhibitor of cysteine peptidase